MHEASMAAARGLTDPTRVSSLLEGASFPAALWSGSELRFTWTNSVFCDMLEDVRPQWDLLGMPVRGFLSDSRSAVALHRCGVHRPADHRTRVRVQGVVG